MNIFIIVLLLAGLLLGVDGIYQHFTHKDFIRNRPDFQFPRIYATFPSPNDFGCYLVGLIPFALIQIFIKRKRKIFNLFYLGLFSLLTVCLLLTVSRGAWFAFIGLMFFLSLWIRTLALVFGVLIIGIIALAPVFNVYIRDRLHNFFTFTDVGSSDRRYIWESGWKMFLSKPLIGVGIGTFMFNFKSFVDPSFPYIAYAHNCYLQMLAEIGLIGLGSFLLFLVFYFIKGITVIKKTARGYSWHILLASLAAVLGYCIQMLTDTMFYSLELGIYFWLLLGVGAASMRLCLSRSS